MKLVTRILVAVAALGLVGAATGSTVRPTLKVGISGKGTVTSRPSGIHCPTACTLRGRAGERVTLIATPGSDTKFSHWSAPCGTSFMCTVKLAGSRAVHAFFKAQPPPPPPPPLAAAGHYTEAGDYLHFDVLADGRTVANLYVRASLPCQPPNKVTLFLPVTVPGTVTIQPDHTFSLDFQEPSGPMAKLSLSGIFDAAGNATGTFTMHAAIDLDTHYECDSGSVQWAANRQ